MNIELNWTNVARYGCPDEPGVYFCKWNNGDLETYEYFAGDSETSPYWNKNVENSRLYVTWWCEIPPEMDPEHRPLRLECQRCGEIGLECQTVSESKPYIETWECSFCHHTECYHVAKPQEIEHARRNPSNETE